MPFSFPRDPAGATPVAAARARGWRWWGGALLFAVLYLGTSRLGVFLADPHTNVTPVWPASGLALAALLRWGGRSLWGPLVVVALVESASDNERWLTIFASATGNILGPLLGAWLVSRVARGARCLERPADVVRFVLRGAAVVGIVSATLGVGGSFLAGDTLPGHLPRDWFTWCVSDMVGILLLGPALLAWSGPAAAGSRWRFTAARAGESAALGLTGVLVTQAAFGGWPFPAHHYSLEYLGIPVLMWAAFRFPRRGVTLTVAVLGALALADTLLGRGPFAESVWSDRAESLVFLQVFLGCTSLTALATAAAVRESREQAAALEDTVTRRTAQISAELAERVRAEQALGESRATLRSVIDLLPQAVWWKDLDGVYLGCNQLVVASAGLETPADLVGKTDLDLPWAAGQARFFRAVDERVVATGQPELRFAHQQEFPGGRMVTLETSKVPLRDAAGRVVGVLGTSEDISARESIEAELRAARADLEVRVAERTAALARANERLQAGEERFRRAILDAPIPIMLHAEDGEILTINRAWTALTGYQHEHIPTITHWVERAYPPAQREVRQSTIRELHDLDHATERGESVIRTLDGGRRVWDFSSAPLGRLPDGRRLVITSAKDVTARRQDEDALRASEERLLLALGAGHMSVWQFDVAGGRIVWSASARPDGQGWTADAFPATFEAFTEDVVAEDRPMVRECIARCIAERAPMSVQYRFLRRRDGQVRWLDSRAQPRLGATGRVEAITGLTQDITARRAAEDALRAAMTEAERANAAKSEFLSRMSHELRTPLNAILGFGQLLELADLEPKHVQSVEHILRGGRHLLGLIDEVLDIARIESGQLTLLFEPVHAGELMAETVNLLRPLAASHDVRVRPGGLGGQPLVGASSTHILADRQRLKQVLLNLLSNAVKYNRPHGEVFVSCRSAPGRRLCLEVRDTGRGFAPEDLARLFTPFERFGAERDGIEGTGIGLVIARRLVESMGGRIFVESTPGVGSTFRVELACTAPPEDLTGGERPFPAPGDFRDAAHASLPAEALPPAGPPAGAAAASRTVLYIEDNLSNLQLIERVFERRAAGQRIALLSAMQGSLGLDLARQHRPDLILLDLQLPDFSGEEVLERLRADATTRAIPVIILSADATVRQREHLLAAGAVAYLTKPLDVSRFLELVNRTLEASAA